MAPTRDHVTRSEPLAPYRVMGVGFCDGSKGSSCSTITDSTNGCIGIGVGGYVTFSQVGCVPYENSEIRVTHFHSSEGSEI